MRSEILPSCGGYEAHYGSEPGNTLVGWYPSKTKASAALRARSRSADLDGLFLLLAHIQCVYMLASKEKTA